MYRQWTNRDVGSGSFSDVTSSTNMIKERNNQERFPQKKRDTTPLSGLGNVMSVCGVLKYHLFEPVQPGGRGKRRRGGSRDHSLVTLLAQLQQLGLNACLAGTQDVCGHSEGEFSFTAHDAVGIIPLLSSSLQGRARAATTAATAANVAQSKSERTKVRVDGGLLERYSPADLIFGQSLSKHITHPSAATGCC